jgi:hypothetical protein
MKNNLINGTVFLIALALQACQGTAGDSGGIMPASPLDSPPYVITKPVFEISGRPGYFNYAAVVFKFLNTSPKDVDHMTVSFTLFDPKTQGSPFIGSNIFDITKLDYVLPGQNKEMIISLDKYIYVAPAEPYLIDFFYISEIVYTDGSSWQDKYGKYRVEG